MRAEQFDQHVAALVRALRAAGVEHVLLEDDDVESVTVVPGPSRRNLERLVRVLERRRAAGRVPGEIETLPVNFPQLLRRGTGRWSLRIDGADTDILIVDVADGRYGQYYETAVRHELEPGFWVDVVPDAPIMRARPADALKAMPELSLTQRQRDRERLRKRFEAEKAERRARRKASRGRNTSVPALSDPRTFATLDRPRDR